MDPPQLRDLERRIEDLNRRIRAVINTTPVEDRKLLTYHDSFPFFSTRYGLETVGKLEGVARCLGVGITPLAM